jgi:hypothetical protein
MQRLFCLVGIAVLGLQCPRMAAAEARSAKFELTVDAGKHDRSETPVAVLVTVPKGLERATHATLFADDVMKPLAIQVGPPRLNAPQSGPLVREIDFVLPRLAAGHSARFTAEISTDGPAESPADDEFHWKDTPGDHDLLTFGDRPVMQYMYHPLDDSTKDSHERTCKVYHHVFDSTGKMLLTKGPGGQDSHHRGLFYGFNEITYADGKKRANVWECTGDCYQSHEGFLAAEAGPVLGRHLVAIDWHGEKREVFAHERREMTVYNVPGGTLIDFASELKTADGPVKLDGNPQHAGFHFRAPNEVATATSKQTYFVRPDGVGKPGDSRNWDAKDRDPRTVNLPWKGMSFVTGGQRYTAALLDRPSNPKEARYSERPYGRFGSYFEYELTKDHPLSIAYRFWVQDGTMTPAQIARLADDFVDPVGVTVKSIE